MKKARLVKPPYSKKSRAVFDMEVFLHSFYPGQWVKELYFAPERNWRFDYALEARLLAVEIEGLTYDPNEPLGAHQRGKSYAKDCLKYNVATLLGWTLYRFTSQMVRRGWAFDVIDTLSRFPCRDVPSLQTRLPSVAHLIPGTTSFYPGRLRALQSSSSHSRPGAKPQS